MEIGCANKSIYQIGFFMKNPDFRKENPGIRCLTTTINHTRANTRTNQKIRILSVTLATEEATFLGSLKKDQGHHAQQLVPVVNSDASRHADNRRRDVLTF